MGGCSQIKGVGHFYRNMPEAREISRGDLGGEKGLGEWY